MRNRLLLISLCCLCLLSGCAPAPIASPTPTPPAPTPSASPDTGLVGEVYTLLTETDLYRAPSSEQIPLETVPLYTQLTCIQQQDDWCLVAYDARELWCPVAALTAQPPQDIEGIPTRSALAVQPIQQNPELPTGCEITALAIVLQHLGYDVDKVSLAKDYLPMGAIGETDFWDAFLGEPWDPAAYGCYAPAIIQAAAHYLKDQGGSQTIYDLTGNQPIDLYREVAQGNPVIVWATINMRPIEATTAWVVGGERLQWLAPNHCMVLIGYDLEADTVTMCDPLQEGLTVYDRATFEDRFRGMFSQAIVIQ